METVIKNFYDLTLDELVKIYQLRVAVFVVEQNCAYQEIDDLVSSKTAELGGIPAPLNYEGYPKSVCTSINEVVCHGIPSDKVILKDGDIINVDVSTIYKGYFSDSSRMFCIGNVSEEKKKLVDVVKECVEKGLEQVKPWGFLGDMGQAVHEHAVKNGYSVVREIGGHGVGLEFHEDPWVSYVSDRVFVDKEDNWTIYTADKKPSAQWEIMVLVTEDGHEVLCY